MNTTEIINPDEVPSDYRYRLIGDSRPSTEHREEDVTAPLGSLDQRADVFLSLEDAVNAWVRRQDDAYFPCWGEGVEHAAGGAAVILSDEGCVYEAWSLLEALTALDRREEIGHYLEPAEVYSEAISSNGASHDIQVLDAWRVLQDLDPAEAAAVIREFPELADDRLIWSGAWVDTEAMGVDPEWSSWLCDRLEESGDISWIEGEPFLVGLDALDRGQRVLSALDKGEEG